MQTATETMGAAKAAINLACVRAGGQICAVDVKQVCEIVRSQPVTPLPKSPPLIEGVIDLRGTVLPVLDLGGALCAEPVSDFSLARIVVVEVDGLAVGLRVEEALEVLSVESADLEPAPALATQAGYAVVSAVLRRLGLEPVVVLSLEDLLQSVYHSEPGGSPDA